VDFVAEILLEQRVHRIRSVALYRAGEQRVRRQLFGFAYVDAGFHAAPGHCVVFEPQAA